MRDEIVQLHAWHRQTELPRLQEMLARMEQLAPGEVSPQQACAMVADVQARYQAVVQHAEPRVVAMASQLTGRELRHMARKFRRNNERYQKEWLDLPVAEQHEKRLKQMVERMETVYGRLDEPQRAVLRRRIEQSAFDAGRSHAEWQRRQQDLLQILRRIAHDGVAEGEARALLQEGCATFSVVHQSTTPAQREQAMRRLRAYQRDLQDLMTQQP